MAPCHASRTARTALGERGGASSASYGESMRPAHSALALALSIPLIALACAESAPADAPTPATGTLPADGSVEPVPEQDAEVEEAADAAPVDVCEAERASAIACDVAGQLTCGADGFVAWCRERTTKVDSAERERALAACLPGSSCDNASFKDCVYAREAKDTPTAAQKELVTSYCATCAPGDASCAAKAVRYDGPKSVTDLFLAAWELSDELTAKITRECTGGALDGGADCARAFAVCAGDRYIDALPACP